jgi:uncharacterized protein
VTESQLDTLVTACDLHTEAERTVDPTLGVCWDSDRLNLWRVGIQPSLRYLSTVPARDVSRIEWTRKLQGYDIPWTRILDAYSGLPFIPTVDTRNGGS